jgi:DNA-binding NarL/FixJ family response regulator
MTALTQSPVSVAIVEDDPRVSRSLCEMLETSEDVCCVGTFPNAEEAIEKIPDLRPRVVLMDIHLPGSTGIECVHKLSRILPDCLFVMLTSYDDSEALFASFSAGASGYLVKPVRTIELIDAVRDVFQGGAPMTSHIARRVVRALRPGGPPPASHRSASAFSRCEVSAISRA